MPKLLRLRQTLAAFLAFILVPAVQATTLVPFTIEELVHKAELIFQGRVSDVRMDEEADGLIYTWVRFEVDDVVKGAHPGAQLELRFLGGEAAGRKLSVPATRIPEEGEEGIYFVESAATPLVNPLLGWSQGRYVIERDAQGNPRLVVEDGLQSQRADKLRTMKSGRSAVEGEELPAGRSLSPEEFKQAIRGLLEGAP